MPQFQTRRRARHQASHVVWHEPATRLPWWLALTIPAILVGGWVLWL